MWLITKFANVKISDIAQGWVSAPKWGVNGSLLGEGQEAGSLPWKSWLCTPSQDPSQGLSHVRCWCPCYCRSRPYTLRIRDPPFNTLFITFDNNVNNSEHMRSIVQTDISCFTKGLQARPWQHPHRWPRASHSEGGGAGPSQPHECSCWMPFRLSEAEHPWHWRYCTHHSDKVIHSVLPNNKMV